MFQTMTLVSLAFCCLIAAYYGRPRPFEKKHEYVIVAAFDGDEAVRRGVQLDIKCHLEYRYFGIDTPRWQELNSHIRIVTYRPWWFGTRRALRRQIDLERLRRETGAAVVIGGKTIGDTLITTVIYPFPMGQQTSTERHLLAALESLKSPLPDRQVEYVDIGIRARAITGNILAYPDR